MDNIKEEKCKEKEIEKKEERKKKARTHTQIYTQNKRARNARNK